MMNYLVEGLSTQHSKLITTCEENSNEFNKLKVLKSQSIHTAFDNKKSAIFGGIVNSFQQSIFCTEPYSSLNVAKHVE